MSIVKWHLILWSTEMYRLDFKASFLGNKDMLFTI